MYSLTQREMFWVTRAKDNMAYEIVGQQTSPSGPVLLDAQIRLSVGKSRGDYPELMRLIVAVVEVDGKETMMSFLTPHVFRRSCTSELVRGNANLYHVSRMLGHESLDTLRHYVRLNINDIRSTHRSSHPRERDERRERGDEGGRDAGGREPDGVAPSGQRT